MASPAPAAASASASVAAYASDAAAAAAPPVAEAALQHALVAGQHHHGGSKAEGDQEASTNMHVTCKWKTHTYNLELPESATVGFMKMQIALLTNVRPHHQKLVLAGAKLAGAKLRDDMALQSLGMKQPAKVMMIGNPESELIQDDDAKAAALEPVDDLDYDWRPEELLELQKDPVIKAKLDKYWNQIKDTFCLINPIREGKKLLVLDLDYTLFDMKGKSEDWKVLKRPGTHRFLTEMYKHYELVIWSQTSWRWLELKLTELGILTHPGYKVCFVLDKTSMFSIESANDSGKVRKHHVKALELIWRKFPAWHAGNTVHVDDLGRNFALNPRNGLKIMPYKNSDVARHTDVELFQMARYLAHLATLPDFNGVDHSQWKKNTPPAEANGHAPAAASNARPPAP